MPVRAVTIRRFLVVGVCAFGVGCLYLVPSVARSPDHAAPRVSDDRPIARPSSTTKPAAFQSVTEQANPHSQAEGSRDSDSTDASEGVRSGSQAERKSSQNEQTPEPQPRRSGATAFDPKEQNRDDTPPSPVGGIRFGPVTPTSLTVRWAPAQDDTGVVGYRLWLDGFAVATTAQTEVTVKWFNDDMGQHVIQLKALDAAGNLSRSAQSVLVTRPTPEPTAEPTPEPTPEPSAEPTDQESEPPSDTQSGKPVAKPTERPHKSNARNGDG
jgi:hypothetical protein